MDTSERILDDVVIVGFVFDNQAISLVLQENSERETSTHEIRGDEEGLSAQIIYCVNATESGLVRS